MKTMRSVERTIAFARRRYSSDTIHVDSSAKLARYPKENGAWVQAWVWVSDEDRDGEE